MEKSKVMRRETSISSCTSPLAVLSSHSSFCWYDEDVWTEIAKFLDGKCLVKLGMANRWFRRLIQDESVWKFAYLRDLQVSEPQNVAFKWSQLYASTFDGSHSYSYRQPDKHIDWIRIGAFVFDSPEALLTEDLASPVKIPLGGSTKEMVDKHGACILKNIKTGIWIADLQLVRCPVCNLDSCEGTMQTLDTRHMELFLHEEYKNGTWNYEEIGSHRIQKQCKGASGGIFDTKFLKCPRTSDILNLGSWSGETSDWQPKARITLHAVAVNTNLQNNEGIQVKYQTMRNGPGGEVVSIRLSQQLI
ncbi:probable F-box protein At3g61730 [Aristolochia californica]|uniref:probable F-box protein At3g61730 n=1 Tax=Aristolochia californica TaxID=171875 RepID=UPI0035E2B2E0